MNFVRLSFVNAMLLVALGCFALTSLGQQRGVRIVKNEQSRRVDVFVDGQPFTSYIWPDKLKKPVLFPLHSAGGTIITRGYPLDPRPIRLVAKAVAHALGGPRTT